MIGLTGDLPTYEPAPRGVGKGCFMRFSTRFCLLGVLFLLVLVVGCGGKSEQEADSGAINPKHLAMFQPLPAVKIYQYLWGEKEPPGQPDRQAQRRQTSGPGQHGTGQRHELARIGVFPKRHARDVDAGPVPLNSRSGDQGAAFCPFLSAMLQDGTTAG